MWRVIELPVEEHTALVDYLAERGIQPGYDTILERATESLNSQTEATCVGALRQARRLLGDNNGSGPHSRSSDGLYAVAVIDDALTQLGIQP